MDASIWSLVPPVLAIIISLITKEVNLSLLAGILVGSAMYCRFNPFSTLTTMFTIMGDKVHGNLGVIIFIILLGMIVYLMNLSGATNEYAKWASKRIKTKKQSMLATMFLGIIIFVDDYFNCLTVGTVMRPITDKNKVSREKLAYIIDSTAAPICMVAPVSSWAAAVSSSLGDDSAINGFQLFMKTIPFNFYTWFTLALILATTLLNVDFGKMRQYERKCEIGDYNYVEENQEELKANNTGKVVDLLLPVVFLILASIVSMLYTGGVFKGGISLTDAFANCDAIIGLAMGAAYTVVFLAILYLPRNIVTTKQYLDGLVEGFKQMVPAALILTFAWTLSGICGADYLNAGGFVAYVVKSHNITMSLIPAVFFIISLLLAFSTGTSWGTFAIMLPITAAVFSQQMVPLMVISTAAVLGGSVCGDHVCPISDTTILSSTGAQCKHINHVETQLQYGLVSAMTTIVCYFITGLVNNAMVGLLIGFIIIVSFVIIIKNRQKYID